MCGIVGCVGESNTINVLLNGLSALEYRGYDSAGISVRTEHGLQTVKTKGKIVDLASLIIEKQLNLKGSTGIGHTRWATHGEPSTINAHPHYTERVAVVHNGIIENYRQIEAMLKEHGKTKISETDTEVIALLIDLYLDKLSPKEAFLKAISQLEGSFAIAAIFRDSETLMAAKNESPLVIGLTQNAYYVASDVSALLDHTREFIILEDGDCAFISPGKLEILDQHRKKANRKVTTVEWSREAAKKGGYKHFMLKEIAEEAEAVRNTIQSRIDSSGRVYIGEEITIPEKFLKNLDRITIVACGTSYYAGLVSRPIIERFAGVPVNVEIASEFRYSNPIVTGNHLFIAISQSGETADTKESLKFAHQLGMKSLSIVNVKESAIARMANSCLYTLAGPEISVASTKAFVSQLAVLYMLAFYLAQLREKNVHREIATLLEIPHTMQRTFQTTKEVTQELAKKYHIYNNFLYLGRGLMYPIALEGALKLKEISYIHAEGYPAGEMKHGPIALIDEKTPTVMVSPYHEPFYSKTISNAEEIKARSGKIIMVSDKANPVIDDAVMMEGVDYTFTPFTYVIPLQLFAYYVALFLGHDIDQPRNLAKSVTVE